MTSIVSICNLALSNIGKDNISALNEPTPEARACNQFYEHVRDMLLQSYPWRWAGRTLSLAEVANDRPNEWAYAYQRPTDCLKLRWIVADPSSVVDAAIATKTDDFGVAHETDGQLIYTDISPAFLRYTTRITDPTKFSPLFVEALSWHLSVRLAMPLTRDPSIRQEAFRIANAAQAGAQMADANEVRETSDMISDLVRTRG